MARKAQRLGTARRRPRSGVLPTYEDAGPPTPGEVGYSHDVWPDGTTEVRVKVGGKVVGWLHVRRDGTVQNVGVDSADRRRGLASGMLSYAEGLGLEPRPPRGRGSLTELGERLSAGVSARRRR